MSVMEKCAAEICVSERAVLRISWLTCGKSRQRPKRWIVCVVTDRMVTAWEEIKLVIMWYMRGAQIMRN